MSSSNGHSDVAQSLGNPLLTAVAPANPEPLTILDTTLRDGEQSPGVALTADDKLAIARQLARLRVDVIEAGFPFSSPGDYAAVRAIAEHVEGPVIAGLSRCFEADVRQCAKALEPAQRARIHVFIGTSPIHRDSQLHMSQAEVLERSRSMTALAKTFREDVEFSPMDASRTEPEYLADVVAATIEAGATTINLPDTVGYATPDEWRGLIGWLTMRVPSLAGVTLSVHCHNDLGLAVANSLASIRAGARQVETCVNGIGERAGNAALEEVAMATRLHPEVFGVSTQLDHSQLYRTSRMVSQLTGMAVQPNKAVVGANAFAHHSGIHQDGILKDRRTFEIMDAAEVGAGSTLVLGKLSGRHALRNRLEQLGYKLDEEELKRAFVRFKELADRKRDVTDRDLEAVVADERRTGDEQYQLEHLQVSCGTQLRPTATVRMLLPDGLSHEAAAIGDGPVDAAYRAIHELCQVEGELEEFAVQAVTGGIDAIGEVSVRLHHDGTRAAGHGADTDIIVAAAKAYVHALNRMADGVASGDKPTPETSGAATAPQR
ncbi:MAG: 2-isopropylmalate synthase [Candidatus Dormibacteraeota bacterium]|uniref:2-isopropylmalate synthase n=1 Tax=Candidatus Aeolococcus gillhamiae TaxID=3127015 RepID=A0A2W5ZDG7_9BACT|nr:2-isopropylmalate synthase [Candidatus Dormibacteraeota bacterium]PZR80836.1 MAG: 2-isopropylmalate synthase [Candidatus Dormibacter sp. RRmetagenome_bin12]